MKILLCNRLPETPPQKIKKLIFSLFSPFFYTLFRWPKREERRSDQRRSEYYRHVLLCVFFFLTSSSSSSEEREKERENWVWWDFCGCVFLWWCRRVTKQQTREREREKKANKKEKKKQMETLASSKATRTDDRWKSSSQFLRSFCTFFLLCVWCERCLGKTGVSRCVLAGNS